MNFAPLEAIANALLYEGYILYPYRASSLKNRHSWNFGTLCPRSFAERQSPPEPFSFQVDVVIAGATESRITACIRFLQLTSPASSRPHESKQAAVRSRIVEGVTLRDLAEGREFLLDFSHCDDPPGSAVPISGRLAMRAECVRKGVWRFQAAFANETPVPASDFNNRSTLQSSSCVSAHLLLGIEQGEFVSLLEPPSGLQADVDACVNRGIFPVLAGETGDCSRMLCSPIILYDYPQVAPESSGDFFDGTEMDEMLALRVLTLTEEEKTEIRAGDPQAAALLGRTETLPAEQLLKLHGAVRGLHAVPPQRAPDPAQMHPWDPFEELQPLRSVHMFGIEVHCGDRVRLRPTRQADILDMAMNGKIAIIDAIEQDLEGNLQFAVVLEEDPGQDLGMLRHAGHRFFFSPEEIQPLIMET